MAIAEKTFQSELPNLLTQLLGSKTTTGSTQTTSANTAPLQQVFQSASQPLDPAMYQQLIQGIFGTAAQQIPQLTAALANATGTRSSNNSPLALALNEQNNMAGAQAAQQIMAFNQNQQQTAANAARGIADSTRSVNSGQTQKTQMGANPLVPLVGGFALNQFDKRGGTDKVLGAVNSGIDSLMNYFNPVQDVGPFMSGFGPDQGIPSLAAFETPSFDFGGVGDFAGGLVDQIGGSIDLGGIGDSIGGFVDTASNYIGDAISSVGDFFGFADGGLIQMSGGWNAPFTSAIMPGQMRMPSRPIIHPRSMGYADGGMVKPQASGMIPARANAPMAVADAATAGRDPNAMMQQILMQAMMPQMQAAPAPSPMNFLRYLLPTSGFNIYQYGDGGMTGRKPGMGMGYADGGMIRNRNYLGGPQVRGGQNVLNLSQAPQQGPATVGTGIPRTQGNGGSGQGVTSDMLTQMMIDEANMLTTGRMGGGQGSDNAKGFTNSPGAAVGNAFGLGPNKAVAEGFLGNVMGLAAPDAVASLTNNPSLAALGPAAIGVMGLPTGMLGMVAAMAKAARADNEGTASLNAAPDPLGAMIGALNAAEGVATPGIGMTNAVAAANAINAATMGAIDGITALGMITNNFTMPGMTGFGGGQGSAQGDGGLRAGTVSVGAIGADGADGGDSSDGGPNGNDGGGPDGGGPDGGPGPGGDGGNNGGTSSGSGGGNSGGGSGGDANGGLLRGPGTGVSDSIRAISRIPGEASTSFSNGEFVIPRDSVEFYGADFFQKLIAQSHSPVRR